MFSIDFGVEKRDSNIGSQFLRGVFFVWGLRNIKNWLKRVDPGRIRTHDHPVVQPQNLRSGAYRPLCIVNKELYPLLWVFGFFLESQILFALLLDLYLSWDDVGGFFLAGLALGVSFFVWCFQLVLELKKRFKHRITIFERVFLCVGVNIKKLD